MHPNDTSAAAIINFIWVKVIEKYGDDRQYSFTSEPKLLSLQGWQLGKIFGLVNGERDCERGLLNNNKHLNPKIRSYGFPQRVLGISGLDLRDHEMPGLDHKPDLKFIGNGQKNKCQRSWSEMQIYSELAGINTLCCELG